MKIKHISFDFWLTLVQSNPAFKYKRAQLLAQFFHVQQTDEMVFQTMKQWAKLFNQINEQVGRNLDPFESFLIILSQLGVQTELISNDQMEAFYQKMEDLFLSIPPSLIEEPTPHYLEALKNDGYTISLLSNTGFIRGRTLQKVMVQLDIAPYFDFCLFSDELRHSKPSAEVFHSLHQKVNEFRVCAKEEILHLGDNEKADVAGAIRSGLQGHLIRTNGLNLKEVLKIYDIHLRTVSN